MSQANNQNSEPVASHSSSSGNSIQHTRGPWKIRHSESKPAFNIIGTVPGCKYKIARCPYIVTAGYPEPYPEIDRSEKEEAEANARLIAVAPELLLALQKIVANPSHLISCKNAHWADSLMVLDEHEVAKAEEWQGLIDLIAEAKGVSS